MSPLLRLFLLTFFILALAAALPVAIAAERNVLLVVLDDVGVDVLAAYGEGSAPADTPTIDALAESGVVFRNAWANPVCSPSRACLMTGRHAFRHGVGFPIGDDSDPVLAADEVLLPGALAAQGHPRPSALIGKWHVSRGIDDPNTFGWQHFAGRIEGDMPDYFHWEKVVDGVVSTSSVYATTDNVDDALAWLDGRGSGWLLSLNCSAPHIPLHLPPADLQDSGLGGDRRDLRRNQLAYHNAMVEALDTELGRLLAGLGDARADTTLILIGDNGTWGTEVIQPPFIADRGKGTLYEGGVNVPLIVAGAGVTEPGREVRHLVHIVDCYATVLELCGATAAGTDSVSFAGILADPAAASPRSHVYTEMFGSPSLAADGWAVRDNRYKLISFGDGREELYDLRQDPFEQNDLLVGELGTFVAGRLEGLRAYVAELASRSDG